MSEHSTAPARRLPSRFAERSETTADQTRASDTARAILDRVRSHQGVRNLFGSTAAPVAVFAIVQTVLAGINLGSTIPMMNDVTGVYQGWINQLTQQSVIVGIDVPWVYPIVAILPMIGAGAFGSGAFGLTWLGIVALLNLTTVTALAVRSRAAAWWWVGFTACLGPVSLGRIDAIALPLAILGLLVMHRRPAVASVLLTLATWVKIWPAAVLIGMVLMLRSRIRVFVAAAGTSAVIVAIALSMGAGRNIASFGSMQAGRGIQVEAPVALPWLWLAHVRPDLAHTYFDGNIITYQVTGPGVMVAASLMTPVLALGVAAILGLAWRARRAQGGRGDERLAFAVVALALVTALIAFNKVGSPQYITWIAGPVVFGLMTDARVFRVPAVVTVGIALLTQVIYPWRYDDVLATTLPMMLVLSVRDVLEIVLVSWAALWLFRAAHPSALRSSVVVPAANLAGHIG